MYGNNILLFGRKLSRFTHFLVGFVTRPGVDMFIF